MSSETKEVAKVAEPTQCTKREILGHAIGVLGHDSAYTLWSTWSVPFMTDILMLPAAFLGVLLAVVRIFDGITDIAMGFIADRTKSRFGRYRAWVLRSGPLFCLCMALSFFVPSENMVVKMVFAGIMYLMTGSIAFTSVDIPYWSLPAAMTSNTEERSKIVGITSTTSNAIVGIIGIAMPVALGALGEFKWTSYFTVAAIVAVFAAVMYLSCFSMVREHVVPDPQQKFSFKLALKNIFHNQPLLCVQIANLACLLSMIMKGSFNYFYCVYNLGSMGVMAVLSTISLVGMVVGALLFTLVSKSIGKKNCMFLIAGLYVTGCVVQYFAGWSNIMVIYACSAITTVCVGAAIVCVNAMMMDTIEYGEWKTGQRNEAMITSTRCFVTKFVMAISGIAVAVVIGFTGYVPGVEQTVSTLNSFHFMITLACGACMVLAVIPMFFYKLTEKRHAEIMVELAARKADKGDR